MKHVQSNVLSRYARAGKIRLGTCCGFREFKTSKAFAEVKVLTNPQFQVRFGERLHDGAWRDMGALTKFPHH